MGVVTLRHVFVKLLKGLPQKLDPAAAVVGIFTLPRVVTSLDEAPVNPPEARVRHPMRSLEVEFPLPGVAVQFPACVVNDAVTAAKMLTRASTNFAPLLGNLPEPAVSPLSVPGVMFQAQT